jgi:hypothetical protein
VGEGLSVPRSEHRLVGRRVPAGRQPRQIEPLERAHLDVDAPGDLDFGQQAGRKGGEAYLAAGDRRLGDLELQRAKRDLADAIIAGLTGMAVSGGVLSVIATCLYPETPPRSRLLARGGPAAVAGVPSRPWVVVEAAGDLWLVALRAAAATSAF